MATEGATRLAAAAVDSIIVTCVYERLKQHVYSGDDDDEEEEDDDDNDGSNIYQRTLCRNHRKSIDSNRTDCGTEYMERRFEAGSKQWS